MSELLTVAVAGCGSRGYDAYSKLLVRMSDRVKIVAAADLIPEKLAGMRTLCGLTQAQCYASAEELLAQPRLADVLLICTPDACHYAQAKAAIERGYHLLLEKPLALTAADCRELAELARVHGRQVVVCHVLRYSVFFRKLKEILDSGVIGQLITMQGIEQVCYWHQAHSFVRGNWRNEAESTCMILAKCCHDMDLILWLTGKRCRRVSSFGHLSHFTPANRPAGAADRCVDCTIADCPYNAAAFYRCRFAASGDAWPQNVVAYAPTAEKLEEALRTGPYGRCVYACDNDVVDHQIVNLELEDGMTVAYTMTAFTAQQGRMMKIMGSRGEVIADMEANTIRILPFGGQEELIDVSRLTADNFGHAGGDAGLIRDLVNVLTGAGESPTLTSIDRSVESHLLALAAEESRRRNGAVIELD